MPDDMHDFDKGKLISWLLLQMGKVRLYHDNLSELRISAVPLIAVIC